MSAERRSEVRPRLQTSNFSHVKIRQSGQTESEAGPRGGGGAGGGAGGD